MTRQTNFYWATVGINILYTSIQHRGNVQMVLELLGEDPRSNRILQINTLLFDMTSSLQLKATSMGVHCALSPEDIFIDGVKRNFA